MKEIPTASHLANLIRPFVKDKNFTTDAVLAMVETAMKDYARKHVEAALEAASKYAVAGKQGAFAIHWNRSDLVVDKDSILNAYDLNLIK